MRPSRPIVSDRFAGGDPGYAGYGSRGHVARAQPPRPPARRAACLAPTLLVAVVMVMVAALTLGLGPALESLVLTGGPGPWYPAASPPAYDSLASISCAGSDDCWASGADALAHWSGGGWTSVPVTSGFGPEGITCVSEADCWGLGSVIEHWSGDGWQAVPSSAGEGTNSSLSAVTCAGVDECWAVGSTTTDGNGSALIEEYSGGTWTVNSRGTATTALDAVTCVGASDCWAVGCSAATTAAGCAVPGSGLLQPLIEHYTSGEWHVVNSPSTSALGQAYLTGVACSTSSDCWAVGSASVGVLYESGTPVPTIPPVLMRYSSGR